VKMHISQCREVRNRGLTLIFYRIDGICAAEPCYYYLDVLAAEAGSRGNQARKQSLKQQDVFYVRLKREQGKKRCDQ
jgi:hypothetical protein